MPDFFSIAASDNFRLVKSKPLKGAVAAGTWNLIQVPKWSFVAGVWAVIDTACSSLDVSVGWAGNTETAQVAGFMSSDIVDAGNVGTKAAIKDTLVSFPAKYFGNGSGVITATLGTAWSAGMLTVFCQYSVIH